MRRLGGKVPTECVQVPARTPQTATRERVQSRARWGFQLLSRELLRQNLRNHVGEKGTRLRVSARSSRSRGCARLGSRQRDFDSNRDRCPTCWRHV